MWWFISYLREYFEQLSLDKLISLKISLRFLMLNQMQAMSVIWDKALVWPGHFQGLGREGKNAAIDHQRRNERTNERDQPLTF